MSTDNRSIFARVCDVGNRESSGIPEYNTIQYSFISAQHICSVHVMSVIVVDIYINAGLGDSY